MTNHVSMVASKAVDGDITPGALHCAHPLAQPSTEAAWWQVDLGDVYVINSVTIVNGRMYIQCMLSYRGIVPENSIHVVL